MLFFFLSYLIATYLVSHDTCARGVHTHIKKYIVLFPTRWRRVVDHTHSKLKKIETFNAFVFWPVYRVDSSLHLCVDNKYQIQIQIPYIRIYRYIYTALRLTQSFCSVPCFAAGASCQALDKLVCDLLSQCIFPCLLSIFFFFFIFMCLCLVFSFLFCRLCFYYVYTWTTTGEHYFGN